MDCIEDCLLGGYWNSNLQNVCLNLNEISRLARPYFKPCFALG